MADRSLLGCWIELLVGISGLSICPAPYPPTPQHVAIELGYDLEYVHISNGSFTDSTISTIAVGFTHTWGGNR